MSCLLETGKQVWQRQMSFSDWSRIKILIQFSNFLSFHFLVRCEGDK